MHSLEKKGRICSWLLRQVGITRIFCSYLRENWWMQHIFLPLKDKSICTSGSCIRATVLDHRLNHLLYIIITHSRVCLFCIAVLFMWTLCKITQFDIFPKPFFKIFFYPCMSGVAKHDTIVSKGSSVNSQIQRQ